MCGGMTNEAQREIPFLKDVEQDTDPEVLDDPSPAPCDGRLRRRFGNPLGIKAQCSMDLTSRSGASASPDQPERYFTLSGWTVSNTFLNR